MSNYEVKKHKTRQKRHPQHSIRITQSLGLRRKASLTGLMENE